MLAECVHERRKFDRKRVLLAATLKHLDRAVTVRVVDVSPNGVSLVGKYFPERDGSVELQRNGERLRGRITWETSDRAGVQFEKPYDIIGLCASSQDPRHGAWRVDVGLQ